MFIRLVGKFDAVRTGNFGTSSFDCELASEMASNRSGRLQSERVSAQVLKDGFLTVLAKFHAEHVCIDHPPIKIVLAIVNPQTLQ